MLITGQTPPYKLCPSKNGTDDTIIILCTVLCTLIPTVPGCVTYHRSSLYHVLYPRTYDIICIIINMIYGIHKMVCKEKGDRNKGEGRVDVALMLVR